MANQEMRKVAENLVEYLETSILNRVISESFSEVIISLTKAEEILALLKEQDDLGAELTNAVELIHKKNERIKKLLKEQEPVKAIADGEDSYICNNCGTVIGWAEWEPGGIEEVKYKFCPECGRPVNWE